MRTPGRISPSIAISARAMACAATVTQSTSSTGLCRRPPATVSSSKPSGTAGGSEQEGRALARGGEVGGWGRGKKVGVGGTGPLKGGRGDGEGGGAVLGTPPAHQPHGD